MKQILQILHLGILMFVCPCFTVVVNAQGTNSTLVYASDFENEMPDGVPTGWVTYNEAGYHLYGFNDEMRTSQFTYGWGGKPGGGGNRLYAGFSGDFTKALYWGSRGTTEGYAEFGSLVKDYIKGDGAADPNMPEGLALKLEPGNYHADFLMAAWKGAPTFTVTLFDLDGNIWAKSENYVAAPSINGQNGANVTGSQPCEFDFSVNNTGYYILRFTAAEATWQEYLLASVNVYKKSTNDLMNASFENPIDVTNKYIPDADFELNQGAGIWKQALSPTVQNFQTNGTPGKMSDETYFLEAWNGSAYTGKIYASLTGLPNGFYQFTLSASSNGGSGCYFYAGNESIEVTSSNMTPYTVLTRIEDGTLEVGLNMPNAIQNWVGIDDAKLLYLGNTDPHIYTKSIRSLIADAESLVVDNHYTTGKSALQKAITKAKNNLAGIVYVKDPDETESEAIASLNRQVIEVMRTLQTAIDSFVFGNDHVDITEKVLNSSFDRDANNSQTITSWVANNFKQNHRDASTYVSTRKNKEGTAYSVHYFTEQWCNSSQSTLSGSGDIHQVITGLPAGHYRLTADILAHNQTYNAEVKEAVGIQLYANNAVREIGLTGFDDNTSAAFSVDFDIVAGQDATIGFCYDNTNVNWVGWDNVTLLFIGDPAGYNDYGEVAENSALSISNLKAGKGTSIMLPVYLTNTESITAMQFEISLPTSVTISKCQLTDRKGEDHTASYQKLANGNYQVTVISLSKEVFSGKKGAVVNLTLDVNESMTVGNYPISLTKIELTTANTQAINPADVSATLTVSNVKIADADGNGKVSITDAVAIVSHILGNDIVGFVAAAADVDGNGRITITDAVAVVDMILRGSASAKKRNFVEDTVDPQ